MSDLKIYEGKYCIVDNIGLGVSGQQSKVKSSLTFDITTHNFRKLYNVYNVDYALPWSVWTEEYNKDDDENRSELHKVYNREELESGSYELTYEIHGKSGHDFMISPLKIYCDVIRVVHEEEHKDFLILNITSFSAAYSNDGGEQQYARFKVHSLMKVKEENILPLNDKI